MPVGRSVGTVSSRLDDSCCLAAAAAAGGHHNDRGTICAVLLIRAIRALDTERTGQRVHATALFYSWLILAVHG